MGEPQTDTFNGTFFEVRSVYLNFTSLQDEFGVVVVAIWKIEDGDRELEYFAPVEVGVPFEAFDLVNKGNRVGIEVKSVDFAGHWSEAALF
ncbi:MAG: hypothetical protein GY822_08010 [Deltaproteobacteria bacterium]|nr:hypothetical protein [Deltaproteobacteria bacterium]